MIIKQATELHAHRCTGLWAGNAHTVTRPFLLCSFNLPSCPHSESGVEQVMSRLLHLLLLLFAAAVHANLHPIRKDLYKTLGIIKTATPRQIKQKYRKLVTQIHPQFSKVDHFSLCPVHKLHAHPLNGIGRSGGKQRELHGKDLHLSHCTEL